MRLFLAFLFIPFIEMYLLIRVGEEIGALATILIVLGTASLGAALTRIQGWRTLRSIQESLAEGRMPASEMLDGVLIFAAGLVLITPGFLTDAIGFALLTPPSRRVIKRWLWRRIEGTVRHGSSQVIITHFDEP